VGSGPFCAPTLHCLDDASGSNPLCARFCCDDGDCGGGLCDRSVLPLGVGVCVNALEGGVDPTCAGDAGGPPPSAPSNGACFVTDASAG
jgi:hypothetical protein